MNNAKGYDLFGNAVIKILDKYKDWKAIVVGDEPREKIVFNHKRLIIKGFSSHNYILDLLKKLVFQLFVQDGKSPLVVLV